jgi:1-acyl-sn-glycerol-3-phosphate acyltransferase
VTYASLKEKDARHHPTPLQSTTRKNITTSKATRYFRIIRIVLHTLVGMLIASLALPLASKPIKLRLIRWWCKHLLAAFNIRVVCLGQVPASNQAIHNTMFVANHITWADIHALNSIVPLRFIAKSEIKSWPIFGYLAEKANALFIDRSKRHDAARIVEVTAKSLSEGDNLCLFPEGTTTDGTEMRHFKSSLIQAAIQADATIWPVAIQYPHPNGGRNTLVAYAGGTTLTESLQQVLLQKNPVVELHFLAPIVLKNLTAQQKDRRALTTHIQHLIRHALKI